MATGDIVGFGVGDKVRVKHLKHKGELIEEEGLIVDLMEEPLNRIKVQFEGSRYPRPLWISPRLLRELERGTGE